MERPLRDTVPPTWEAARVLADPVRTRALTYLQGAGEVPASLVAKALGVPQSTFSAHLAALVRAGWVEVNRRGRFRYARLSPRHEGRLEAALEALAVLVGAPEPASMSSVAELRRLRFARRCYDHLAGGVGVALLECLLERGAVEALDGEVSTRDRPGGVAGERCPLVPGERLDEGLRALGVEGGAADVRGRGRPLAVCVDWSEWRLHAAGRVGRALMSAAEERGYVRRVPSSREMRLTESGRAFYLAAGVRIPA